MPKDPDAGLSLIRIYDQLENYIGKELYFVIENGNETGFSFINVDDFRTSMTEKEVIALQNETMAALITMEDPYKETLFPAIKKRKSYLSEERFVLILTVGREYALLRYEVMMPKQSGYRMGQV